MSLFGIVILVVFTIQSFVYRFSVPITGTPTISYADDVLPILESRCAMFPGKQWVRDRLDLRTYAFLMKESKHGPVIIAGNTKQSPPIRKIHKGELPKRGPRLFPAQLRVLVEWINAWSPDN